MKEITTTPRAKSAFAAAFAALASCSMAFADYNSYHVPGAVTCIGRAVRATISSDRKQFSVSDGKQLRVYKIVDHDTDGDTRFTVLGELRLGRAVSRAELSFDDQGDNVLVDGRRYALTCPNGR